MWYEYFQTGIDGYVYNDKLCYHILIEANSADEANNIANELGINFDEDCGYESSVSRWQRCYYELSFPSVWDSRYKFNEPNSYCEFIYGRRHSGHRHTKVHSRIYYKNGKVVEVGVEK